LDDDDMRLRNNRGYDNERTHDDDSSMRRERMCDDGPTPDRRCREDPALDDDAARRCRKQRSPLYSEAISCECAAAKSLRRKSPRRSVRRCEQQFRGDDENQREADLHDGLLRWALTLYFF
jgi:hypothetical protein